MGLSLGFSGVLALPPLPLSLSLPPSRAVIMDQLKVKFLPTYLSQSYRPTYFDTGLASYRQSIDPMSKLAKLDFFGLTGRKLANKAYLLYPFRLNV